MGIYIKIADEMPKSCYRCPVDGATCKLWRDMPSQDMMTIRHSQCPLITDNDMLESKETMDKIISLLFGN